GSRVDALRTRGDHHLAVGADGGHRHARTGHGGAVRIVHDAGDFAGRDLSQERRRAEPEGPRGENENGTRTRATHAQSTSAPDERGVNTVARMEAGLKPT